MTYIDSGAWFSECRRYRYALWRRWDADLPMMAFIGLNPSTADEVDNDPTVRRCIGFAKDWGYGELVMLNLFAYRSTDPRALRTVVDPIGEKNKQALLEYTGSARISIAAWGNDGVLLAQSKWARESLPRLHYLRLNKGGEPGHPLYLPATLKPTPLKESVCR